jgi:hypothetical protein
MSPFFAYDANYLIDNKLGIIVDAEPLAITVPRCFDANMVDHHLLLRGQLQPSLRIDFWFSIKVIVLPNTGHRSRTNSVEVIVLPNTGHRSRT